MHFPFASSLVPLMHSVSVLALLAAGFLHPETQQRMQLGWPRRVHSVVRPIRDIFRYVGRCFVCKSEKKSSLLHVQSSMELWNRYRRFDLSCLWTVSSMIFIRGRGEMPLKKRTSDPVGNGDSVSFAESNSCQTCRPANFVVNNKLLLLFF